jgi:hypothetical protein
MIILDTLLDEEREALLESFEQWGDEEVNYTSGYYRDHVYPQCRVFVDVKYRNDRWRWAIIQVSNASNILSLGEGFSTWEEAALDACTTVRALEERVSKRRSAMERRSPFQSVVRFFQKIGQLWWRELCRFTDDL